VKAGDLVELIRINHWGGRSRTGNKGVLVRRLYSGYDPGFDKWEMLINGSLIEVSGRNIRKIFRDAEII
tara:strand:+ start:5260 stop:5466 length:207 start_codon:yes stop_codon:yes gene_type:complete